MQTNEAAETNDNKDYTHEETPLDNPQRDVMF